MVELLVGGVWLEDSRRIHVDVLPNHSLFLGPEKSVLIKGVSSF